MVCVEVVSTEELGDRSYVAHDGKVALVVDPQRDIDRIEQLLSDLDLRCALVAETHIHNDYVSGGLELARRSDAPYLVSAADDVAFSRQPVVDGEELRVGRLHVKVVATPGHTDGHVSYVVDDGDGPEVVFTGGSLLFGSVGRTDLVDTQRTVELTRAQYRSTRHLAVLLADDVPLYPTHGFGSFCSSGSTAGDTESTVGAERSRNDALVIGDEDEFVAKLVAGLTAFPSYYAHMGPRNRQGPGRVEFSTPEPTNAHELRRRITSDQWVVDLRSPTAFAAAHLEGTIGIGLGQHFATYLGWLIPWGTPLTLLGESAAEISSAQRQLVRIGIDHLEGAAVGRPTDLTIDGELRHYPTATFADLTVENDAVVLDVRRDDERSHGHIPGSVHIPLHCLLRCLVDVPEARLWVHCASGYRASIAASLLDRVGRDVVLIDDDFENAESLLSNGSE